MIETVNCREDLETAREWLRTADIDEALQTLGHQGAQTISRFEVSHAPDSSTAEFVGSSASRPWPGWP